MSLAVVRRFGLSLSLILLVSSGAMAQRSYDDNSNTQQAPATVNITQGPTIQYADDQFAVITWTTDQPFVSRVFYGKDASNLNQISEDVRSQSLRHQINLRNLQPSTTYYFRIDTGQGTAAAASTDSLNGFQTTALGANPIRNQQPFKGAVQNATNTSNNDSGKTANFGTISFSTCNSLPNVRRAIVRSVPPNCGRVADPGLMNRVRPTTSSRQRWVCPWMTTS